MTKIKKRVNKFKRKGRVGIEISKQACENEERKKSNEHDSMPVFTTWNVALHYYRLVKIKEWVDERDPHATVIPFSGALEQKVSCLL